MYDVVVIGCGPAGMTAAIYLKQAGINVAIMEKNIPGGAMNMAMNITNYPGCPNIKGSVLAGNMLSQVRELNIPCIHTEVIEINDGETKQILTPNTTYEAKYVIIATGRKNKELGLLNEEKFAGNGISYSILCDVDLYKDKEIMIVGNSNEVLDQAIYLSDKAFSITIINDDKELDIDEEHEQLLEDNPNIHYLNNSKIIRLVGDEYLEEIEIENTQYNEIYMKKLDHLFVLNEYEPRTSFLDNLDINKIDGYIQVNNCKTNIKNIYAVGDVTKKQMYQIVTAASDGALAAYDIISRIKTNN